MSRSSQATQSAPTPVVKVSTADESNCQAYEYNDPSADPAIYTTIVAPGSRSYIIESRYSLEALAK